MHICISEMIETRQELLPTLTFTSRLTVEGSSLPSKEELLNVIIDWCIDSAKKKIDQSVSQDRVKAIINGGTAELANEQAKIEVESCQQFWQLRYSSNNQKKEGEKWQTSIEVLDQNEGGYFINISCRTNADNPFRTTPGVVRALLEKSPKSPEKWAVYSLPQKVESFSGLGVQKSGDHRVQFPLTTTAITTSNQNDQAILNLINDQSRSIPVIICSPTREGEYLIEPDQLAQKLAGQAYVFRIPPKHDFRGRGAYVLDADADVVKIIPFGGFLGAFYPWGHDGWQHRVFDPNKFNRPLENFENIVRSANLRGELSSRNRDVGSIGAGTSTEDVRSARNSAELLPFLGLYQDELRKLTHARQDSLREINGLLSGCIGILRDRDVARFKAQIEEVNENIEEDRLKKFLLRISAGICVLNATVGRYDEKLDEVDELVGELDTYLEQLKQGNESLLDIWTELQEACDTAQGGKISEKAVPVINLKCENIFQAVCQVFDSVQDMVSQLEKKYGDKIEVLDTAKKGARDMDRADGWKGRQARTKALGHMFNAIELFLKMGDDERGSLYLTNNKLETEHVSISKDYEQNRRLSRLASHRTFYYDGVERTATLHLKYGVDPQKSIRVYYHRTEDGKLLITHISHHLPTMSSKKDGSIR